MSLTNSNRENCKKYVLKLLAMLKDYKLETLRYANKPDDWYAPYRYRLEGELNKEMNHPKAKALIEKINSGFAFKEPVALGGPKRIRLYVDSIGRLGGLDVFPAMERDEDLRMMLLYLKAKILCWGAGNFKGVDNKILEIDLVKR